MSYEYEISGGSLRLKHEHPEKVKELSVSNREIRLTPHPLIVPPCL